MSSVVWVDRCVLPGSSVRSFSLYRNLDDTRARAGKRCHVGGRGGNIDVGEERGARPPIVIDGAKYGCISFCDMHRKQGSEEFIHTTMFVLAFWLMKDHSPY